jgi:hypothetical protein
MTANPSSTSDPRLQVINLVDVPKGGWRYVVPDTNTVIQAGSIHELKRRVKQHMIANTLDIPRDIDAGIEDCACLNLEANRDHWCAERGGDPLDAIPRERPRWKTAEILRFLKTVWEWGTKEGFKFVEKEEAGRRAAICVRCPMNTPVSGCLGCTGVAALIRRIQGTNKTSQDANLHTCNVCGCELRVKVLVPLEVIDNSGLAYPEWCWQSLPVHEEGEQHHGQEQAAEDHEQDGHVGHENQNRVQE